MVVEESANISNAYKRTTVISMTTTNDVPVERDDKPGSRSLGSGSFDAATELNHRPKPRP